jgi:mRNA interferase MazF
VPFPFVEGDGARRRPALVVSSEAFGPSGHVVLAMITTSTRRAWPGDVELVDLGDAGLHRPCILRLKLFTLDRQLVLRTIGRLSARDRKRVGGSLRRLLANGGR